MNQEVKYLEPPTPLQMCVVCGGGLALSVAAWAGVVFAIRAIW